MVIATSIVCILAMIFQTYLSLGRHARGVTSGTSPCLPKQMYEAIRSQPADTVIAGIHRNVPIYHCLRAGLFGSTRPVIIHTAKTYYREIARRSNAYLSLLFAKNSEDFLTKLSNDREQIDLFLFDRRHFVSPRGGLCFASTRRGIAFGIRRKFFACESAPGINCL